jgi:hypothetical protein
MGKRTIIVVWLIALALAPFRLAETQQQTKVAKIGWLGARSALAPVRNVFERELRSLANRKESLVSRVPFE